MWVAAFGLLTSVCARAEKRNSKAAVYQTTAAIHSLSPVQANHGNSAQIRGVITYVDEQGMVVHDSTSGIWVYWAQARSYSPGDELDVKGVTASGIFAPVVDAAFVHKLGRAALPKPQPVTFDQLSSGDLDSQYVSVEGMVRSASVRKTGPSSKNVSIKLRLDRGFVITTLPADAEIAANKLVGAVVKVTATAMCSKNNNRQIIAPILAASGSRSIIVLRPPPANPFSEPLTPISRLMQYRSGTNFDHRVHVTGTVTYYQPGEGLIIQDGRAALSIKTNQSTRLSPGDRVEVLGFPAPQDSGPILEDAIFRRISTGASLSPTSVSLATIRSGTLNYNLITTEGHLLRQIHEPLREILILQDDSDIMLAELDSQNAMVALHDIPEGSLIRVTGISTLETDGLWNYGIGNAKAFRCKILLRSPADVYVVGPPPWWTTRHVIYIAVCLGFFALIFLIQIVRSLFERWRLQAVLAERERLAHEIHDTLAQSFAGIGFQLQAIRRAVPQTLSSVRQQLDLAQALVRHSHKEARRSIEPLRSEPEEPIELLPSLEECARRMVEGGNVRVLISSSGKARPIPPRIANSLLRIGQEAIANAVRHADPGLLEITLFYKSNAVMLSVQDDGVGFVKSGDLLGFGLRGMRTRAAAISANLEIKSHLGSGTCITVSVRMPTAFSPFATVQSFWDYLSEHLAHAYTEQ